MSVRSLENRLLQPRGSPSYSQECRAVQLESQKEWIAKSSEFGCNSFELELHSHLNLNASVCFHLLASVVVAFVVHVFSCLKPSKKQQKLSVQRCLHKLCRKLLSEDCPVLFAEAVQLSCRSCA